MACEVSCVALTSLADRTIQTTLDPLLQGLSRDYVDEADLSERIKKLFEARPGAGQGLGRWRVSESDCGVDDVGLWSHWSGRKQTLRSRTVVWTKFGLGSGRWAAVGAETVATIIDRLGYGRGMGHAVALLFAVCVALTNTGLWF